MNRADFPNCCTAKIVYGFDKDNGVYADHPEDGQEEEEYDDMKEELLDIMYKQLEAGDGAIVISTHDEQAMINAILEEVGFTNTGWISKRRHSEYKIAIWTFPLEQLPQRDKKQQEDTSLGGSIWGVSATQLARPVPVHPSEVDY